jgi:hypothetical protein
MEKKKIYVLSAMFVIVVIVALVFFMQKSDVTDNENDLEFEDVSPEVIVGQAGFNNFNFTCEDSDGGLNWEDIGTVTLTFDDGNSREFEDYCIDETHLMEMRCVNDMLRGARFTCHENYFCDAGVCIEEESLCTETDGGQDYYTKGTTTGLLNGVEYSGTDECGDIGELQEFYCDGDNVNNEFVSVPDDYVCDAGVGAFEEFEGPCTDTDGGQDYYAKGTATGILSGVNYQAIDRCDGETGELYEVYCDGNYVRHEFVELPEGYICDEDLDYFFDYPGCTDSDDGQNPYEKGTTVGIYQNQDMTLMDRCTNGRLYEYYCADVDYASQIMMDPPEGYTCDETEDIFVEI